jgi:hypothetical protein
MSYLDHRNSIMGEDEQYDDLQEALYASLQKEVDNFRSAKPNFVWNSQTVSQFENVPIETLIRDEYFLGFKDKVYDGVLQDIKDLFEERKRRDIHLGLFLEGIGAGKTVKASILTWLNWFYLSMKPDPQDYYDLAPRSVIAIMQMSRSEQQARKVTFTEVWNRFQSPFNLDYFPSHQRFTREIRVDQNNTCIFAGTSSGLSALGYNLFGATIDEACFLEVVEDSKRSQETFDAAEEMYYAIYNRMLSRFLKVGRMPGLINMVSSPRFPNDFMNRKIEEAIKLGVNSGIFWRRRSTWEAKGKKYYPQTDAFYIDTENSEIIMDESTKSFLDTIPAHKYPLNVEIEALQKISPYLRKAA